MSYTAENDIRRQLGQYADGWPRAGGKPPTVADGLALADTAQGTIDAILAGEGIVTPVPGPTLFTNLLRDLCAIYAASFIVAELFPQAAGPGSTNLQDWLMKQYRAGIADLRLGDIIPPTLTKTGGAMPTSYWTSNPVDEDGNDTHVPAFRREMPW